MLILLKQARRCPLGTISSFMIRLTRWWISLVPSAWGWWMGRFGWIWITTTIAAPWSI